jgi:hypothetical protein
MFTIDELREVFDLAPLPNGEGAKRMQTLNVVDASKANKYQVGEDDSNGQNGTENPAAGYGSQGSNGAGN